MSSRTLTAAQPAPALDILIADDDELLCARIEALLTAHGLGALSVHSLIDAREAMRAVYFPLVILDRHLGDGDGADLCREYRARQSDKRPRILMLSADDSSAGLQAALAAGADDFVSKRSTDQQIMERVLYLYRLATDTSMSSAPISVAIECSRIATTLDEEIFQPTAQDIYQDIVRVAAALCKCPMGLITLADRARQTFTWKLGNEIHRTAREHSFCAHAIEHPQEVMVVTDTHGDVRFSSNPFVLGDPHIRFYAGAPLIDSSGQAIGTLCAFGAQPQTIDRMTIDALQALARRAVMLIEHARIRKALEDVLVAQRATQADLRRSDTLLKEAFEHSPIGIALVSIDGRWLRVNQALCDMVGYAPERLLRTSVQDITHPDDVQAALNHMHRILESGLDRYDVEQRCLHQRGHAVWVHLTVTLVRDENDAPLYFVSHIQDIGTRKAPSSNSPGAVPMRAIAPT